MGECLELACPAAGATQGRRPGTSGGASRTSRPAYRVVHFCIRGDIFNRAKAKAKILSLSLADYVAVLMERDKVALAQLAEEEEQHGSA